MSKAYIFLLVCNVPFLLLYVMFDCSYVTEDLAKKVPSSSFTCWLLIIIFFQNAEELTEEGLPFLILFHAPEDTESIKKYTTLVHTELADQKRELSLPC